MGKQSKGGGGNILLLAGLGVGAFMLFANKGSTQSRSSESMPSSDAGEGADADIPAAPRILAVNNSSSESPLPTGIVSDEEGMESTTASPTPSGTQSRKAPTSEPDEDYDPTPTGTSVSPIPPLISTTLTPREKQIINQGQLTNDLAIQRPDLFRAIYIRKHGRNGKSQQALQAADAQIARIQAIRTTAANPTQKKRRKVSLRLHPKTKTMVKTARAVNTGKVQPGANTGKRVAVTHAQVSKPTGKPVSRPAHPQKKTVRSKPVRKPATPPRKPAVRKRR